MKTEAFKNKANNWIDGLKREAPLNTVKTYQNAISCFMKYLDSNGVPELNRDIVVRYKNELTDSRDHGRIKTSTLNLRLTTLNKLFKETGVKDCFIPLEKTTVSTCRDDSMTESDYKRLIRWADKLGMEREKMIMKTLVSTGIRISELEFFTVESLKGCRNALTVKNKGKERSIIIPDRIVKELEAYSRKNNIKSGMIFQSSRNPDKMLNKSTIWRNLKKIAGKARVKKAKIHAHSFRRLYAQRFLEDNPGHIDLLADLMGHSSLETTRLYTRLSGKGQKHIVNDIYEKRRC